MLDNYNVTLANINAVRTKQAQRVDAIRVKQVQQALDDQTIQQINQSIQSYTQSVSAIPTPDELDFSDGKRPKRDGKALTEARVAAAKARSANCVFDGRTGCAAPVGPGGRKRWEFSGAPGCGEVYREHSRKCSPEACGEGRYRFV